MAIIVAAIAKNILDSFESSALCDHIDQAIEEILQIEENLLDRMIWPIEENPGWDLVSLDYACRLATANDCQFLDNERAKDLQVNISTKILIIYYIIYR